MRTAKAHPQLGWLRLQPRDYSRSFDKLLAFRDEAVAVDQNASGCPQAYIDWVWEVELPGLLVKQSYKQQLTAHLDEIALRKYNIQRTIEATSGSLIAESNFLTIEDEKLRGLLDD